jgi:hypothetical protein
VYELFIYFKKAYDSVSRAVFGVPMKLFRLVKLCLNETYGKVFIGKHLSKSFPIQNGLKQGDALLPLLFKFVLQCAIKKVKETEVGLEVIVKKAKYVLLFCHQNAVKNCGVKIADRSFENMSVQIFGNGSYRSKFD